MAELTMLHRVAVLTSSENQLERIMAPVVVEAASIFHADAVSIALEDEHGDYRLAATFGLSEDYRKHRRVNGAMASPLLGAPVCARPRDGSHQGDVELLDPLVLYPHGVLAAGQLLAGVVPLVLHHPDIVRVGAPPEREHAVEHTGQRHDQRRQRDRHGRRHLTCATSRERARPLSSPLGPGGNPPWASPER